MTEARQDIDYTTRGHVGVITALDPGWRELGVWVSTALGELFTTEDHRQGVRSFLERREPRYVGR